MGTVLAITFPDIAVSSAVVNASFRATGASLTADTVMLTVAVLESNDPSLGFVGERVRPVVVGGRGVAEAAVGIEGERGSVRRPGTHHRGGQIVGRGVDVGVRALGTVWRSRSR